MRSKIALRLTALALGAAFVSTPVLAQEYGPPQSPGIGPSGDARYGLYNEAPGYYGYSPGGYFGGAPGGYYDYSSNGYLGAPPAYNYAPGQYRRYASPQRRHRVYNYSRQRISPSSAPAAGSMSGTGPAAAKQPMGRP